MLRQLQTPTRYNSHILACLGDSHTLNHTKLVRPAQFYPESLAVKLRALGCFVRARNWGYSGDTTGALSQVPAAAGGPGYSGTVLNNTPGLLPRSDILLNPTMPNGTIETISNGTEVPAIAVLYAGTNDSGKVLYGQLGATAGGAGNVDTGTHQWTTTFVGPWGETIGYPHVSLTLGSGQTISLSAIPIGPVGTTARKVYRTKAAAATGTAYLAATISDNTTTTATDNTADSGLGAALSSYMGNVGTQGGSPYYTAGPWKSVDNLQRVIQGLLTAGCSRIVLCRQHYLNYSASGDLGTAVYSGGGAGQQQQSAYSIRVMQDSVQGFGSVTPQAPVLGSGITAFSGSYTFDPTKVIYYDAMTDFHSLLGTTVTFGGVAYNLAQGDHLWHVADSDSHLNALGEELFARGLLATIQAQTGWVAALKG